MEPKIRLKGFSGEWETKNIASVASLKAGSSIDTSQEISYPSQGYYPCYGGNGLRGYVRDYTHDGIYNIIGRQGALCGNVKMVTGKFHATEHAVVVTPTKQLDPYFLFNVLTKANINQYATGVAQPGLSVQNVNKSLFINIPDFDEQKAIGAYFQHLDSLIQSTTKKIESLKQVKVASLQSMFPQEGETTPRVRFKGFDGEWEMDSIKNIATFSKGRGYSKSDLRDFGTPIVLYGRLYTKYEVSIYNVDTYVNPSQNSVYSFGDEVIMPASGETPEDISIASAILSKGIILGGDLNVMRFDTSKNNTTFIALSLSFGKAKKDLSNMAQGKSVVHLHNSDIEKISIPIPSYEEQQKIASYFTNLDSQINLQTQRLEKLKQIKSACLDNMFV